MTVVMVSPSIRVTLSLSKGDIYSGQAMSNHEKCGEDSGVTSRAYIHTADQDARRAFAAVKRKVASDSLHFLEKLKYIA